VARRILAVLLVAMAAGQLSDFGGFVDIVATYRAGGNTLAALAAAALIVGQAVGGVGLLAASHGRRRRAAGLAVAVAVVWSLLAVQAFARGLAVDNCGCFGVHLGQPLRWWVLVEDAELIALALWVRHQMPRRLPVGAGALAKEVSRP
jgi:hypothetical protein